MTALLRGFAVICVGTCLTLMILVGYFASRGTLNVETGTKVVALVNGIDITGDRLQRILRENEDSEQPDFDEILEARKRKNLDTDLRLRSQSRYRSELSEMLARLVTERERFDERREAFERKLDELEQGAVDEGIAQVQRMMQEMEADKAKEMLKKLFDDQRIDDVVNIVQAIPRDTRRNILAEFETGEENDMLYQVIRRIGEGLPVTSLIDEARGEI